MREYIAQVVSLDDPEKYQRARVRVFEKFPRNKVSDKDLPWATYRLPAGSGVNEGLFVPAVKGEFVWTDFPFVDGDGEEDTSRPRITGSVHYCPDGIPNLPHDSFEGEKSHYKNVEPPSEFGYSKAEKGKAGETVAFTKQGWSFRLHKDSFTVAHARTKARMEFTKDGHFDVKTPASGFVRAKENLRFLSDKASILMNSREIAMVLKSAGKFRIKNSGASLKDALIDILKHQKQTLDFLKDFISEYASHSHISPGYGAPTPPPITAAKAAVIGARAALESPKVGLTKSKVSSLLK